VARRLAGDPAGAVGLEPAAHQPRVVVALHHHQRVAGQVLAGDEPRVAAALALAPHAQALALTQRVEGQPQVLADDPAVVAHDGPGLRGQVAVQELAEGPLADEADAGGVLLGRVGQADALRDLAYLALV